MNYVQASTALQVYLNSNWSATPLAFNNVEERNWTAVGQPILPEGDSDYVTLRTHIPSSTYITVPGHCRRYFGTLFLAVAVRKGTGTRTMETYITDLIALFEGKTLSTADGELRVWTLTGNAEYELNDWFVNEIAFGFSFERFVA